MSGSTFGRLFRVTTFGESHGAGVGCIIDGCPSGLLLNEAIVQPYLDRRRPGQSKHTSQRKEPDTLKIVSGTFEGRTTGAPIMMMVENQDAKSKDYEPLASLFRPGHADFTYAKKYGVRDWRGGGRASARETLARVAAGAVAMHYLKQTYGLTIIAYLKQMHDLVLDDSRLDDVDHNPFFSPDPTKAADLEACIEQARKNLDSVGARVNVVARGVPIGLGEPVFDKLSATLAHAMMSIPAAKGVEIGDGFDVVGQTGQFHRDAISREGFLSNHAGGMLGGISTGQEIRVSVAFKPTASIPAPIRSINVTGEEVDVVTKGRHDPCVGIRAVPVCQAMMALVLMDHVLIHRAYQE